MTKQKKKRNKVYRGVEAATSRPTITKLQAVNRNPVQQWWYDRKRVLKPTLIAAGVTGVTLLLIYELIRLVIGS
jgi:hypothetical protein